MFHGVVFTTLAFTKIRFHLLLFYWRLFWVRQNYHANVHAVFLRCLINLHPLLLSFFAPWHFSAASCVVIRADQQQQAPVILDPPSVSDRCQSSAIHLAAILLLRAHAHQKVCLIA